MKSIVYALFPLLLTGLVACKSKSARDFSEKIVSVENSLIPDITKTENQVSKFFAEQNYDSAAIVSRRMEDIIANKIEEVEKLEPPHVAEADNFKKAFIKYFEYMKSIYTGYKLYAMQTNDEDRAAEWQKFLTLVKGKDDAIEDVQRAQAKFAKANGFRIENK